MSSVGHCDEIENVSEKSIKKKKNAKTKKEKRTKSKVEESNDENENKGNETETNVYGFLENKKDEKGKNEAERKAEKNSNLTKDEEDKTSSLSKFDIFDESPDATDLRKFDTWKILEKIARILFCGFLFIFVLGSSFISRITFHILIANLNPPTNFTTMNTFGGHYVTNSFNETVSMTPAVVNVSWIWALYISMIAPYIYNFFYYLLNICMKYDHKTDEEDDTRHLTVAEKAQGNTTNNNTIRIVMYILGYICLCILQAISETVALMYFLPTFDPSTAAVLSIVFFMTWPCLSRCFQTVSSGEKNVDDNDTGKKRHLICLKICSFCLLALSIILMIVYVCLVGSKLDDRNLLVGLTFGVFALALSDTSCFENAIASSKTLFMRRNVISTVGNIIKVPVSFLGVIAIFVSRSPSGLETQSFEVLFYISQNVSINMIDQDIILSSEYSFQNNCVRGHPFIAAMVCVISGYLGFKASYIACRINLQRQSFVVPMILSFIATPFILWSIGNSPQKWNTGACDLVPDDWLIDTIELDFNFIPLQITSLVAALVCLILQVKPIWMNGRKLASLNEIFITPLYNGRCLDVSLLLSREISEAKKTDEKKNTTKIRPYIYMCATMWHEDRQEMKTLLRSIFRFYLKQLVIHFKEEKLTKQKHNKNKNDRKTAKSQNANDTRTAESQNENDIESGKEEQTTKKTRYCHPHRYDFEVHIFFDDAFEDTHVPNKFAQSFIETIKETGSTEFGGCKFPKPAKYNTPYGARIEWDLWNTLTNKHEDANLDNVKTNEKQRKAASAEEDKDENSVSKVTKEEISKEGDEDGATTASNVPVSEIQDEDHRDANTDNEKREANTDNERKDSNTDDEKIEENTDNEKKDIKTDNVEREPKQSEAEIVEKNKDENDDYGKLVVHLKDKSLIRHKKRWSQVMYVYYLLNLKFQQLYQKMCKVMLDKGEPVDIEKAEEPVKSKLKKIMKLYEQNTFILALDGDVDFKPHAIRLLIDRMTKNLDVGATCGRIIPIGKGPVVWYQKFEYAASHWLQKSTEHVFGCVLCSPGCFSLFRASALMSTDVIKTYTKRPEKPSDHIQYDQGEDRWLSTLLLKSGYKLEYTAASDAHTFAPEGFPEFFRQRRRWSPSTMANLLDILWNTGPITKKNASVTKPFLYYQMFLFFSSIITPGTIFLMILGAIHIAFPGIPIWLSFLLNLTPVALLMLSCLTANDGTQILIAGVTSALYSLTMVVVIVGLIIDAVNSQFCSVSTYFFTYVVGIFILSAICHPREIKNVFYGIIYFLAVPSTSMLMMLYALGNLHVTSWGTREGKKNANKDKRLREEVTDGYTCSCFGLFSCTCMPKTKTTTNTKRTKYYQCTCCDKRFASEKLMREHECRHVKCHQCSHCDKRFTKQSQLKYHECVKVKCCYKCSACEKYLSTKRNLDDHVREHHRDNHECSHCVKTFTTERRLREHVRQDHRNECKILSHDTFEKETFFSDEISNELDQTEIVFWKWLIDNILYVENIKEEKKEEISSDLIVLRNTVYFAFFLANGIYVTLVFVLAQINEMNDEKFTVKLPCPNRDGDFEVDPISIVFTLTFGIVLLIQFYGMLLHRFSTFVHIMAVTRIIKDASEEYDPTKRPKEESKNNQIHLFSPTEKLMQLTPIEKPTLEKFAEEIEKDINSQPEKMYKDRFIETPLRKTLKSFVSYMEKQTLESSTTSSTIHDKNQ